VLRLDDATAPVVALGAVLQLLYTVTTPLKWLFPHEKATFDRTGKNIQIGEPL
jgi:hypothetical protein